VVVATIRDQSSGRVVCKYRAWKPRGMMMPEILLPVDRARMKITDGREQQTEQDTAALER